MNAITPSSSSASALLNGVSGKDGLSRLQMFTDWLARTGGQWHAPDLAAYRDWLMSADRVTRDRQTGELQPAAPLSPASASAHLSTIRGRYQALVTDNATRAALYALTPGGSAADRKAFVDEAITRLENAVKPDKSSVKVTKEQDTPDEKHLRLTISQANALLAAPLDDRQNTPLQAVRDTALIALMLCTGIREAELCALDVTDLRAQLGGALALHVRQGKGSKARLIPYGSMDWCLIYVEKWLSMAGIADGAVFRGFYKGGKRVRATRLTVRAVQDILNRYPVSIDGAPVGVNPHDLRRTYARRLYEASFKLIAIQQNLGHADSKTTERYIGELDASHRQPPQIFRPPHLKRLETISLV